MPRGIPNRTRTEDQPESPRVTHERAQRRRRDDATLDRVQSRKLSLPDEYANDRDHFYYWANDENNRVHHLTTYDDYDPAPAVRNSDQTVRRLVGTKENGDPLYAVLLRKPMEYHRQDQRKREQLLLDEERSRVEAPPVDPSNPQAREHTYVVPGSSIKRGAYSP